MTEELFRTDARLDECDARVTQVDERGVRLDRTVFYPHGGGQAGDRGELAPADGRRIAIADTRKGEVPGECARSSRTRSTAARSPPTTRASTST